jgi:hypothetical protein
MSSGEEALPGAGECVSITSPDTGCARDKCAPCSIEHGRAKCDDETNVCALFVCDEGYMNCYSDTTCDTDIAHDPNNCDECYHECTPPPNAYAGCSDRRCVSGGCHTGYKDCSGSGGNDTDGCETRADAPCPMASTQSP